MERDCLAILLKDVVATADHPAAKESADNCLKVVSCQPAAEIAMQCADGLIVEFSKGIERRLHDGGFILCGRAEGLDDAQR